MSSTSLWNKVLAIGLVLAPGATALRASGDDWEDLPALIDIHQDGQGPRERKAPSGEPEAKETKRVGPGTLNREVAALRNSLPMRFDEGLYPPFASEGFAQRDVLEWILGPRADRPLSSENLRRLEVDASIQEARAEAAYYQALASWKRCATQVDAGRHFGSNVCYRSPLVEKMDADLESKLFGPDPLFLDVGAGCGFNTKFLAEAGARVVANDQSTEQMALLRQLLSEQYRSRVHLSEGNILLKNFPRDTFHGILASHVFHYLSPQDLETLVRDFHRWLKPGGRLYIQCFNINLGCFSGFRHIWDMNKAAGIPWPGSISNAREIAAQLDTWNFQRGFLEGFGDYVHPIEITDLVALLKRAGFTVVLEGVGDLVGIDEFGQKATSKDCLVTVVAQVQKDGALPGGKGGRAVERKSS